MARSVALTACALLLVVAPPASAQSTLDSACTAAQHRQFDFWLGAWTVTDTTGRVVGTNEITRIAGGCGLREHWRGAGGSEGMSLNVWQPAFERWTQFWVGTGVVLELTGGPDDAGRMVLEGTRHTAAGAVQDRITWTPRADGTVRQRWEISEDAGASWRPIFVGLYHPREPTDISTTSIDAVLTALYDVISGPAGEARDWDRFRSLFLPGARLIPAGVNREGVPSHRMWSVEDYIAQAGPMLEQRGFYEREIGRVTERFGNIAHAFTAYESRRTPDDPDPFQRGINSVQLYHDGTRWRIVTVLWDWERDGNPLPARYLGTGEVLERR